MSFIIKGVRITVGFPFFAAAAAAAVFCHSTVFYCALLAAAIHEVGHIAVIAASRSAHVRCVRLGALGIVITSDGDTLTPPILCAGAAANLAAAAVFAGAWILAPESGFPPAAVGANVCLALCNLLPAEPLDGGLLLRCLLERRLLPDDADRLMFAISLAVLFPLTAAGILAVLRSRGNYSLLVLCLWLLAGVLKRYL